MEYSENSQLLGIVQKGLPQNGFAPKKVVIIGAGMAGLTAGYELKRAGHNVTILEATQRVGGRILTIREPFGQGLHGEGGAMRLPVIHKLTQAYVSKFDLQTVPFTKVHAKSFYHIQGQRQLRSAVDRDSAALKLNLTSPGKNQTILKRWEDFILHTAKRINEDEGYWDELMSKYGDMSLYEFFRNDGWDNESITSFGVAEVMEVHLANSFMEVLQVEVQMWGVDVTQIVGGMDRLPNAFLPDMQQHIHFGSEMTAIDHTSDSVTIHYRNKNGLQQLTTDFAIITIPFPVLRQIDVLKPFSHAKQTAIRQLHYENAIKIFLQCHRRFWEEDEGLFGGVTVTDLPNRLVVYPEHGRETGKGILMAAYAFGEEANRWAMFSPDERIYQALKQTAKIHPQVTSEFELGISKVWGEDRYAGGAFAFFQPGQQGRLYKSIVAPEGPIYFAGEHTTYKHMWIEGAVESGLRAAREIHQKSLA